LVAQDIDRVSTFLADVFEITLPDVVEKPVRHRVMHISEGSSVLVIHRTEYDERKTATISLLAVHQIFVAVDDPAAVQLKATQAGAQVTQSNVDEHGGSVCVFEGPERITFYVISREKVGTMDTREIVVNALWARFESSDSKVAVATPQQVAAKPRPPSYPRRPVIPTMDVSILSNNSKNFVSCPPNSREAIQFETELFKGSALLICRTNPDDDFYKSFFTGK
jgi:predicted enzyme related to lactoylglutathione lyase